MTATSESLVIGSSGFVTAPYGDYWKFMKKLLATKLLRPQAIEQSRGVRAEELERFYFNILNKAKKKESIEIVKEGMKFTNNMICRMSMGRSCSEENGEAERVMELVIKSVALTTKIVVAYIFRKPLEKLGISLFKEEIMGVSREFDELLERILVEHEEKQEENQDRDMMNLLLEAYRDEKAEYKITRNHIKSLFVEIFSAGTDSSATTTQWTMAEIVNNPNVLERLREEIDSVVGKTRLIKETDLPNLPFLQAVVKEGLRLHPPGPLLIRTFQKSCEIKGFYIPEKTSLVVNVYAVMRDPNYWEDPDEFKPERFLASSRSEGEDEIREQALKYLPFGSGRRGCPGSNLAYIFLGTAIGMLVQCFDWRIKGEKVNMEDTFEGVTLTMAHPLKCIPILENGKTVAQCKAPFDDLPKSVITMHVVVQPSPTKARPEKKNRRGRSTTEKLLLMYHNLLHVRSGSENNLQIQSSFFKNKRDQVWSEEEEAPPPWILLATYLVIDPRLIQSCLSLNGLISACMDSML
ncbi:hypothetical protein AALP_AA5G078700 [Arabis alpina]|uniref:UBL3-like ubiquitin domain-containing protein n=1 Tax=Arabis alpina TaxID=50452 RepID=A0A087GVM2_ARAAL|nr:hypothetical protein AALP_AA5G078700 [Arabis alpina]